MAYFHRVDDNPLDPFLLIHFFIDFAAAAVAFAGVVGAGTGMPALAAGYCSLKKQATEVWIGAMSADPTSRQRPGQRSG